MTPKLALHPLAFLACLVIAIAEEPPSDARLLNNHAVNLYREGKFDDSERLYRVALALASEDGLTAAKISTNLGLLYERQDRYTEAESMYKHALELRRNLLPPTRPELAYSMNNVAEVYRLQGRYWEARNLAAAAVQALEQSDPQSPEMAAILSNLGALERHFENLEQAELVLRRALSIGEKLIGPESRSVAITLNNLAQVAEDKKDYYNAGLLYKRSTAICESLGSDYERDWAIALANMGRMHGHLSQYEQAKQEELRALAVLERQLQSNMSLRAVVLHNLGNILNANGEAMDSLTYFDRALAIEERILGREHPLIINLLLDYSNAADHAGIKSQARKLRKRGEQVLARSLRQDPARFSIDAKALRDYR